MKNQKLILVWLGALLTTALFYQESWGVNILLFSLVVSVLQFMSKKDLLQNTAWLLVSLGTFLAGLGFNFTNSAFAAILYVLSMVVSVYLHQNTEAFWPLAPFHAIINLIIRPFEWLSIIGKRHENRISQTGNFSKESNPSDPISSPKEGFPFRLIVVPCLLFFSFIVIYGLANQSFGNMVDDALTLINFTLFVFLAGSLVAMIPILDSREISPISEIASFFKKSWSLSLELDPRSVKPLEIKQKEATISFIGLIGILVVLLGFEVNSLVNPIPGKALAEGVHENIYAVIGSIILAALATVYYFSGQVFFMSNISKIKQLAFTWIALNGILALIGIYKTCHYMSCFGLTYKRLAVIEYLVTILTGLVIVSWCIYYRKGNWKLVNLTIGYTYAYIVLFNLPNWDRTMVRSNFTRFEKHHAEDLKRLSVSGYAEFLTLNLPGKPYPDPHKIEKVKDFQDGFASHGFLSKTFEDYRIQKDLAGIGSGH